MRAKLARLQSKDEKGEGESSDPLDEFFATAGRHQDEENRRKAGAAAAFIVETRRRADTAKPEADYIAEAIITVALAAFQILDTKSWLLENVKVWVTCAVLAVLLVLILRRKIITPLLRKIVRRPPR
ncbi:MAG: hypothetical protein ABSG17_21770 [Spirochaetia bacterium]